jgi:hypothetical protein
LVRLIVGTLDKLCTKCPGGVTKMERLPMTNTWMCPVCSGTDWYIPKEAEDEQWMAEE